MKACRACLCTDDSLNRIDEAFVNAYNILTNLDVSVSDSMPQYVCDGCVNALNFCIEFREKCITTEKSLQDIILEKIKSEDEDKPLSELKKIEISEEINIKEELKDEDDENSQGFMFDVTSLEIETNSDFDLKPEDNKEETVKKIRGRRKKYKKKIVIKNTEDEKPLICGLCKENFLENQDLSTHVEKHKNDRNCGVCLEPFDSFPALVGHRITHIPKNQRICHMCKRRAFSCPQMEYHYMHTHFDGEKTKIRCPQCSRGYATPLKLRKHINCAHKQRNLICDYCSKRCNTKSSILAHIRSHMDKSFACDMCDFATKRPGGLKLHKIRMHSGTKILCKTCGRAFGSQEGIDKHKCPSRINICPVCGIRVTNSKHFSRHMDVHAPKDRYKCDRCPAVFKSKGAFRVHLNKHDGIRSKQCEFCPQKFYCTSVLTKHRRIHTGEKPFVCSICQKGFTGRHNLKVHMKVHGLNLVVKRDKGTKS